MHLTVKNGRFLLYKARAYLVEINFDHSFEIQIWALHPSYSHTSYTSILGVWVIDFERGSTQIEDPFLLSLFTDQIRDLSLVSSSCFDLVTLGGWGLLGGSDHREQSTCDCLEVCTGLEASPRPSHSGSSFYLVEEAHGEEGVPSWRQGSFMVTRTSPTVTSFPWRKWTSGYIIVSTCFGYFYPFIYFVIAFELEAFYLFHHLGCFT
jgi:hypothetical protein